MSRTARRCSPSQSGSASSSATAACVRLLNVRSWPKADPIFRDIDQIGTSAFRPKPDIRLDLVKRSANDPKRPSIFFRKTIRPMALGSEFEICR